MANPNWFQNLTDHVIRVLVGGSVIDIPPCGRVAHVKHKETVTRSLHGIPVIEREVESVDLPEAEIFFPGGWEGGWLKYRIVSSMVLDAIREQGRVVADLYAPDTGTTAVRNDRGQVEYVTRLVS